MLNYIALYVVIGMVGGILQEHTHVGIFSEPLPDSLLLARILPLKWNSGMPMRLHSGVLIAIFMAPLISMLLFRTATGFVMRLVGQNAEAARVARFPVARMRLQAMAISGMLCGMAGVIELLGVTGRVSGDFSPGWGFKAIPVALLGGLDPIGVLFSALFFGALTSGCGNLERTSGVSSTLINIVQAATVLAFVGIRAWQSLKSGEEAA